MTWLARYTKKDSNGKILRDKIGVFTGGNCVDVVSRVCVINELHNPKEHSRACRGCRCEFVTTTPNKPEESETHLIEVSHLDSMIDL